MIAEGTDAAAVTVEQIQAVAADIDSFARKFKISRKDIGKAVGYSPSVITEFIGGSYRGNKGEVAIDLDAWLVEEEQRRSRPATTQFVWTNIALEIKAVANYCLDKRSIGMIYGPDATGIGKTTALRAIQQEFGPRRSALVTIDKVDANPTGLLCKICRAMRLGDNGRNSDRFKRIKDALTVKEDNAARNGDEQVGRSHLLIIDQIHNLRWSKEDKPFYILTDLWDATQTAQLWCGTADLVAYLHRQQKRHADESLAQIRRRIFPRRDLMESLRGSGGAGGGGELLVTIDQVREMFAKNKLKLTTSAARFLCELCNSPDSGAVGLCVQLVEYATHLAEIKRLAALDLPLLKEAMRGGFSPDGADVLMQRVELEHAPMRAANVG